MKLLDVIGTGVKAATVAVVALVAPASPRSREAQEELRRRSRINGEAELERARRTRILDQALDDRPSWLGPRRRRWLR